MDKLGIQKASIVGWSDGGIIGLDMAIRHPERLDKLFAFGANYNLSGLKDGIDKDPTFNAYIERAGKDYERLSATPKDYEAFVNAIVQMWTSQPDFSKEQLGAIKSPVAISDGEHDDTAVSRDGQQPFHGIRRDQAPLGIEVEAEDTPTGVDEHLLLSAIGFHAQ